MSRGWSVSGAEIVAIGRAVVLLNRFTLGFFFFFLFL
jgi:hypothetical protein